MQADEDADRLQKQVEAFKLMKYRAGYNDRRQDKRPRYPFDVSSLVR